MLVDRHWHGDLLDNVLVNWHCVQGLLQQSLHFKNSLIYLDEEHGLDLKFNLKNFINYIF